MHVLSNGHEPSARCFAIGTHHRAPLVNDCTVRTKCKSFPTCHLAIRLLTFDTECKIMVDVVPSDVSFHQPMVLSLCRAWLDSVHEESWGPLLQISFLNFNEG